MKVKTINIGILIVLFFWQVTAYAQEEVEIVLQTGHTDKVEEVAFSPDGKLLASASADKTIRLWTVPNGKLVRSLSGHTENVKCLTFSPDGKSLASSAGRNTAGHVDEVRLWDIETRRLLQIVKNEQIRNISSLSFGRDGNTIFIGNRDSIHLLSLEGARILKKLAIGSFPVSFSQDSQFAATGGEGSEQIQILNLETGHLLKRLEGASIRERALVFSSDGKQIASADIRGWVRLWNWESGELVWKLEAPDEVNDLIFSMDGQFIIMGDVRGKIRVWETNTGKEIGTFEGHRDHILSLALHPNGQLLVTGGWDHTIRLWDWQKRKPSSEFQKLPGIFDVKTVALSSDGNYVASGSWDGILRIWSINTGELLGSMVDGGGGIKAVVFSPDNRLIATGSTSNTIRIWEWSSGKVLHKLRAEHSKVVSAVAFSPSGSLLAAGSYDATVRVWEVQTGNLLHTLKGHMNWVKALSFINGEQFLLSAGIDNSVRLWDIATGKGIEESFGPPTTRGLDSLGLPNIAISKDGKYVASGSEDSNVRVWERQTGKLLHLFEGHQGVIWGLAFSADGRYLASNSTDNLIKLWDLETGTLLQTLRGHTNRVMSLVFNLNGTILISGGDDGSVNFWQTQTGHLMLTLVGFSNNEWVAYTPSNYYISSPKGDQYVTFRVGNKMYDFAQYASIYQRPEIVAQILRGEDIRSEIAVLKRETGVDVTTETVADLVPPDIIVKYLKQGGTLLEPINQILEFPTFILVAQAVGRQHGIDRFVIEVNDQTVLEQKLKGEKEFLLEVPIELKEPENSLKIVAWSKKQVKSYPRTLQFTYKAELQKGWSLPKLADYVFGKSKSWAVVIGINSYSKKDNGFEPLPHAVDDAKAVQELFLNKLGFAKDHLIAIFDHDATKQRLEAVLGDELPRLVGADDRVVIYFSGHGATRSTRKGDPYGYIVPINGKKDALHSTAISMDQIHSFSELIPAKQVLFIVDACYSGIRGTLHKKGELPEHTRQQVETFIKSGGRQIMTAGTAKETVVMGPKWDGHSVYTYHLIQGLKGRADYNKDGVTTTRELQVYLDDKVPNDAKQTPQLNYLGTGEGQFVFYQEGVF